MAGDNSKKLSETARRRMESEFFQRYAKRVPQKEFCLLSGRQAKQLKEQAIRYGFPIDGPTVDLYESTRSFFDFIGRHASKLVPGSEDPLLDGASTPWLERYREERTKMARLERHKLEGQLIGRSDIHEKLGALANVMHQTGDHLGRRFGPDAAAIFNQMLEVFERQVSEWGDENVGAKNTMEDE